MVVSAEASATRTPTIAVDAMGGDFGPEEIVKGVARASLDTTIQSLLVGDERRIQEILDGVPYNPEQIAIEHTAEHIEMGEEPKTAMRKKRRASISLATQLVAAGRADIVVTAGNTGAAMQACSETFEMITGVQKPALASVYPRQTEHATQDTLALLLDVGATVRCDATELVQFALMGNAYARRISKVAQPRVALLNMGIEENRGGEVLVEAHRRLRRIEGINFIGNIEGNELARGRADVIVCEGLMGSVVLRLLEGLAEVVDDLAGVARRENWRWKLGIMMLASGFGRLRDLTDYAAYGGAPVLGFRHLLIKSHGRSNALAVHNAGKVAAKAVRDDVTGEIATAIQAL
jgi:glycerol-3-phosphate acyltransferase PlsX